MYSSVSFIPGTITLLIHSFLFNDITIFNKESYVNNRERGYLERAIEQLNICIEKSNNNHLLDEVAEEINILNNILGNVSGKIEAEEIINEIFENFCIGK